LKFPIKIFVLILYLAVVWSDADAFDTAANKFGRYFCFRFANIAVAEEKLAIQV
jgi:hypothetical protein